MEEWRAVCGYEGLYEVSDLGRVRRLAAPSLRRGRPGRRERVLAQADRGGGRPCVTLCRGGVATQRFVYHLVLGAFVGPRPPGMQACHINGDPTDSRPTNLRWDTPASNQADRVVHGTDVRGRDVGTAKLGELDVAEIRTRAGNGEPQRSLARHFGVTQANVWCIVQRKTWAHVK